MRATPLAETESRTTVLNTRNARAGLGLDGLARRPEFRQMASAPGGLRAGCTALLPLSEGNSLSKRGSYGRGMAAIALARRPLAPDRRRRFALARRPHAP